LAARVNPDPLVGIVELLARFIKDIGFPVFIAVYLLVRVDPALRELTRVIHSLSDVTQVAAGLTRRTLDPKP
jgi:YvrJ-like protein